MVGQSKLEKIHSYYAYQLYRVSVSEKAAVFESIKSDGLLKDDKVCACVCAHTHENMYLRNSEAVDNKSQLYLILYMCLRNKNILCVYVKESRSIHA